MGSNIFITIDQINKFFNENVVKFRDKKSS